MWSSGLHAWYRTHGRHDLPWRRTRDPWAVLVSEVMLQQTQVRRVLPRWHEFLRRWPTPAAFAAAPLPEVLRAWDGLGYPRRALALHRTAGIVAAHGWPGDDTALQALPGVGAYTARALLALALRRPGPLPHDVNIARVVRRAALGAAADASPGALQAALETGRPRGMSRRDYVLAIFDVGAGHCRAEARCDGCPLRTGCAAAGDGAVPSSRPRRQPAYAGSFRALRGAVLRTVLAGSSASVTELAARCNAPADDVARAIAALRADGLLPVTGPSAVASRG